MKTNFAIIEYPYRAAGVTDTRLCHVMVDGVVQASKLSVVDALEFVAARASDDDEVNIKLLGYDYTKHAGMAIKKLFRLLAGDPKESDAPRGEGYHLECAWRALLPLAELDGYDWYEIAHSASDSVYPDDNEIPAEWSVKGGWLGGEQIEAVSNVSLADAISEALSKEKVK